ncbi:MAG TPA: ribose-phosphate diphosphokinase [Caulobacteraceae bacterium]|nr:ribose-phosphate diphosphokinase [Caulobacteraceae bacterium]
MTPVALQAFAEQSQPARRLAAALAVPFLEVALHRFPDGELLPRAPAPAETVIVYASLDHPNEKLVALLLAADAWRRVGVTRLVLVAPYLCYMRQDRVFRTGEPLSRDVVCGLLGAAFDRVVTVEAHRHRTRDLSAAFGGIEVEDLSAAGPLAAALGGSKRPLLVGPDAESEPWVRGVAARLGGDVLVFEKTRLGDAEVRLEPPDLSGVRGRAVVLADDVASSGSTLAAAAALLREAGAASIEAGVVHALFDAAAEARLRGAGVSRIVSTDSIAHSTNAAPLADLLAHALRDEVHR